MGIQGPLTAQALGRSPYDDVVEGESGQDDAQDGEPMQQYDPRGRPVNPATKRMNRDIIRAHNEVMLVIGVAEPENQNSGPEADSQRRHEAYEEAIGQKLGSVAKRCVESIGIFGIHGLRQRILIYKRYSEIPFFHFLRQNKIDFSLQRDVIPGAPVSLLSNFFDRSVCRLWLNQPDKAMARHCVHEAWSYIRVHLELYAAMQRLGLIPSHQWLPRLSYFVPFTETSPIPAPPPIPETLNPQTLLSWVGSAFISAAPFLIWVMTQRMVRDWKPQIWAVIFKRLPSTVLYGKHVPPPPPAPPSLPSTPHESESRENAPRSTNGEDRVEGDGPIAGLADDSADPVDSDLLGLWPPDEEMTAAEGESGPEEELRGPDVGTGANDDFGSDEEDNEGVSATLISFDVEATESTDAPTGLWSAELRPSQGPVPTGTPPPLYLDTLLTQLPPLMASHIITDGVARIIIAPYESVALRLAARAFCLRHGLPMTSILGTSLLSGLNWVSAVNFLGVELVYFSLSGEIWAIFTGISQWFHMSEAEWKEKDGPELNWYENWWWMTW